MIGDELGKDGGGQAIPQGFVNHGESLTWDKNACCPGW